MTATTAAGVVSRMVPDAPSAGHELLVGPEDGYGDVALERVTLTPGPVPWCGAPAGGDRLVVVLAGQARIVVGDGVRATLAPNEVVHVGGGHGYAVEVLAAGAAGRLELLVLWAPGPDTGRARHP